MGTNCLLLSYPSVQDGFASANRSSQSKVRQLASRNKAIDLASAFLVSVEVVRDLACSMKDIAGKLGRCCCRFFEMRRALQQPAQGAVLRDQPEECGQSFDLACVGWRGCFAHFLVLHFFCRAFAVRGARDVVEGRWSSCPFKN